MAVHPRRNEGDIKSFCIQRGFRHPSTVIMLVIIGIALRHSLSFIAASGLGLTGWLVFLYAQDFIVKHINSQQ